jgi:Na+-driven multidrug efflux pump
VLNILFVALFHWNVIGVAAATVITQYLSAFLVIRALRREEEAWRLDLGKLCLRKEKIGKILRIGFPAGLQAAMLAASDIPLQTCVNSLGSLAVSGNAAALNIDSLIFITIQNLTQAVTVFTGQCVGARLFDRTRTVRRDGMIAAVLAGLICGAVGLIFRYPLVRLFLPETPEAVAFGADRARAVATFAFIYSVMSTLNASLRGYGVSVAPAVINIFALFVFRLIWSVTWFPYHQTLFHLYISYPLGWLIAIAMLLAIYRPALRKAMVRLEAEERAAAG